MTNNFPIRNIFHYGNCVLTPLRRKVHIRLYAHITNLPPVKDLGKILYESWRTFTLCLLDAGLNTRKYTI